MVEIKKIKLDQTSELIQKFSLEYDVNITKRERADLGITTLNQLDSVPDLFTNIWNR